MKKYYPAEERRQVTICGCSLARKPTFRAFKVTCGLLAGCCYVLYLESHPHRSFVKTVLLALMVPSMLFLLDAWASAGAHVALAVYLLLRALTAGFDYPFPVLYAADVLAIAAVSFAYGLGLYLHVGRNEYKNSDFYPNSIYIPDEQLKLDYVRVTSV